LLFSTIADCGQTDAITYNASLTHLTEEETDADVVQTYAMKGQIMN